MCLDRAMQQYKLVGFVSCILNLPPNPSADGEQREFSSLIMIPLCVLIQKLSGYFDCGTLLSFNNFYFNPGLIVPPLLLKTNDVLLVSFVTAVLLLKYNTPFVLLLNMALPVPDIPFILPELILIVPALESVVLLSPRIIALVIAVAEPIEMIPVLVILTFAPLEVVLMNAPLEVGLKSVSYTHLTLPTKRIV